MVEPLSIITISAAAGGVAGKVVEKVWDAGEKWLATSFKDHQEIAKESARQNALGFLNDLASRMHALEQREKDDKIKLGRMENVLQDPDFSIILQRAILTSSRSSDATKHKLLGRLISDRLNASTDDLVSLAGLIAVDAIGNLNKKHLFVLGIASTLYYIRPRTTPKEVPNEEIALFYISWYKKALAALVGAVDSISQLDLLHLMAVSCVKYEPAMSRDLIEVLSPKNVENSKYHVEKFIKEDDTGIRLNNLWKQGIGSIMLTSVGQLIGVYVKDEIIHSRTSIEW